MDFVLSLNPMRDEALGLSLVARLIRTMMGADGPDIHDVLS